MKKMTLKIQLTFFFFALLFGGYWTYQNRGKGSKLGHQNFVNGLSKIRNEAQKSEIYLAIQNENIERTKNLLDGEAGGENIEKILTTRPLFKTIGQEFKLNLFVFLMEKKQSLPAKQKIFVFKILPQLLPQQKFSEQHEQLVALLESKDLTLEEKSILLQGMHNWFRLPEGALAFLVRVGVENKDSRGVNIALHNYSLVKKSDQLKALFVKLDHKKDKWSDIDLITFLKINLNHKDILNLQKDYFEPFLNQSSEKVLAWDEFRLLFYQTFQLEKKYKNEIIEIAQGSNNIWIKKQAKNILEKIK